MASTKDIFKNFKEDHLKEIVRRKGYNVGERTKLPKLAEAVADEVAIVGLKRLLQCLKKELLVKMAKGLAPSAPPSKEEKKGDNKNGSLNNKQALIKLIMNKMDQTGAKKWLNSLDKEILTDIKETVEIESEKSKTDGEVILAEANRMGLENCFSTFDVTLLLQFCSGSGLDVQSKSRDTVIDCLIERKDALPEKKKKKKVPVVEKSRKKPKIVKGITAVDLQSWYNLDELITWCQDQKIPHTGKKAIVISRIRKHLDGEDVSLPEKKPKKKRKAPAPKSKRPRKKAKTDSDAEKSEKSDAEKDETEKSDKSEKSEPEKKPKGRPKKGTSTKTKVEEKNKSASGSEEDS